MTKYFAKKRADFLFLLFFLRFRRG
jgi:hypothetical protein